MSDSTFMETCLRKIEQKTGWGSSESWSNYDFERLSDEIKEATGVALSVTTLKRIWGKVKYKSVPSVTTLNTLAKFLDYKDWRTFKQSNLADTDYAEAEVSTLEEDAINEKTVKEHAVEGVAVEETFAEDDLLKQHTEETTAVKAVEYESDLKTKSQLWLWAVTAILVLAGVTSLYFISSKRTTVTTKDISKFSFSSEKVVSEGVPNSVVFHYDASAALTDSVYIQQSWDPKRRALVSKNNNSYTSIYYYPGFFKAKLVAGDKVIKEHDLLITSRGWVGAIENEPVPIYLKPKEFQKRGIIDIPASLIKSHNVSAPSTMPMIRLFNVLNMPGLENNSFTFETSVKNDFKDGSGACQRINILILCKNDILEIPLTAKGCVGDLFLYAAGKSVKSTEADLTKFGADLSEWTKVKVEATNNKVHFYVNDTEAYTLPFDCKPTEIVGVEYNFEGAASVKDTKFSSASFHINL